MFSHIIGRRITNINTGSKEELESLPGIGPVLAQRIIEYREKAGYLKRIEDIKKVKGVADKTFKKIKYRIRV